MDPRSVRKGSPEQIVEVVGQPAQRSRAVLHRLKNQARLIGNTFVFAGGHRAVAQHGTRHVRAVTARTETGHAYLVNVKPDEQEVDSPYKNTLQCIIVQIG